MASRAALRRRLALAPDGDAAGLPALHDALRPLATTGEIERMRDYLLDRQARPITDATASPLLVSVRGGLAPLDDRIAAILAAPTIAFIDDAAPLALLRHRFSPRADELVALAVAHQPLPRQLAALAQLVADLGPDPDVLALSTVQCGRVLAWAPHLLEWPIAEAIGDALLALLDPRRAEPLVAAVARALAPLGARRGPVPERIHARARAALDEAPALARAGAYILGFAEDPVGMVHATFLDGLVAAANVARVADLVAAALEHGDEAAGLALAARLPLDPIAPALRAMLDDPEFGPLAARACALLDGGPELHEPDAAPDTEPPADPRAALDYAQLVARLGGDDRDLAWCELRDRMRRS